MTIIQTNKPLQKRHAFDFYETPRAFCDEALRLIQLHDFYARAGAHAPAPYIWQQGWYGTPSLKWMMRTKS